MSFLVIEKFNVKYNDFINRILEKFGGEINVEELKWAFQDCFDKSNHLKICGEFEADEAKKKGRWVFVIRDGKIRSGDFY